MFEANRLEWSDRGHQRDHQGRCSQGHYIDSLGLAVTLSVALANILKFIPVGSMAGAVVDGTVGSAVTLTNRPLLQPPRAAVAKGCSQMLATRRIPRFCELAQLLQRGRQSLLLSFTT